MIIDSWWHETLRLYAAQANATHLVNACREMNTVDSLTLAADIGEEALELEQSVRETLNARLEKDLESADPDRFRLAAEVLLNRRLKKPFYSIDDTRSIDTDLITCVEYQLFIDHMRSQNKYHQPDHWISFRFPKGKACDPIEGVRFENAQTFCSWLTKTTRQTYRLPHKEEVRALSDRFVQKPFFWVQDFELSVFKAEFETKIKQELMNQIDFSSVPILTVVRNFSSTFVGDIKEALNKALDFALHSYRVYGLTPILNLDAKMAPASARDLANDLALTLALTRDATLALDLSILVELDLVLALNIALSRDITHNVDNDMVRVFALSIINAIKKNSNTLTVNNFFKEIDKSNFVAALNLIDEISLKNEPDSIRKWITLLIQVVKAACSKTMVTYRKIFQKITIQLMEFIYKGFLPVVKSESRRHIWAGNQSTKIVGLLEYFLFLYWFLRVVQARGAGKLPAWEGIRLVREFKEE